MIETYCACEKLITAPESAVGTSITCGKCGMPVTLVSAEAIEPGSAIGDFDARLVITQGPAGVGQVLALGGVPDLEIGKSADRHIPLPGTMVSRAHARLSRLDFGPSRWKIVDTQSRNGVFVNDEKVGEVELSDGDRIRIGDFEFTYVTRIPQPVRPPPLPGRAPVVCPGCQQTFPPDTKVCMTCGIDIKTGKPLVTSRALDEDTLAIRVDTWARLISWFMWFNIFPIASEAFGTKKAKSIWWIAGITVGASFLFFIPYYSSGGLSEHTQQLMMWCGTPEQELNLSNDSSDSPDQKLAMRQLMEKLKELAGDAPAPGHFAAYQLITAALIHAGFMHLAGNMLFMLVFGIRVNELIGNLKMAVVYPILAVLSGLAYYISALHGPPSAMLGASGAIMGLAGMYFVFFPAQKVFMLIWFRIPFIFLFYKIFRMSGFWLLVLWVGLNDVLPTVLGGHEGGGGVAHWAHLGGFMSGAAIAIGLLVTRQVSAHGSDVLSMLLGPTAWKIIGRPAAA